MLSKCDKSRMGLRLLELKGLMDIIPQVRRQINLHAPVTQDTPELAIKGSMPSKNT